MGGATWVNRFLTLAFGKPIWIDGYDETRYLRRKEGGATFCQYAPLIQYIAVIVATDQPWGSNCPL